jgi:hypothetical protein
MTELTQFPANLLAVVDVEGMIGSSSVRSSGAAIRSASTCFFIFDNSCSFARSSSITSFIITPRNPLSLIIALVKLIISYPQTLSGAQLRQQLTKVHEVGVRECSEVCCWPHDGRGGRPCLSVPNDKDAPSESRTPGRPAPARPRGPVREPASFFPAKSYAAPHRARFR